MDIKNNIKQIQEGFKGDEKILENAFRLERLYKKYKYVLLGILIVLVAWFGYYQISEYRVQKQAEKTTEIYNELLKNPDNQALLNELKSNSLDLYDLYMYAKALKDGDQAVLETLKDSKNPIIADLATYQYGSYSKNFEVLESLNNTLTKDFAILQEAYLLYEQNKTTQAKALLNQIERNSPAYPIVTILKHYKIGENTQSKEILDK